ncbi:EamA family transporter [Zhengella mangrovi]|uniref:EamA family transporter n=1 Tax=Zhengella mangrovi TaxID=1982044 RepID=A0A2G1QHU3_9HYPH|nr:DMT family transporter [Zhengella mangrovi]PHP65024.1 EamA family transporter [Zhengella mangrovi]
MSTLDGASNATRAPGPGAIALMVVLTSCWGLSQVAMKIANLGYSPLTQCFLRSAVGALCIAGWCLVRGIPLTLRDGTLRPGLVAGLFFAVEFILLFLAMDITSVARGVLIFNSMPFWVLAGSHLIGLERLSWRKLSGMALAFCGVSLVFADKVTLPSHFAIIGDLMVFGAALCWAGTVLVIKVTRLAESPPEKSLLYQLGVSAIVTLPFIPLGGPALRDVGWLPTATLAFQALFIVSITYLAFFRMVQRYSASSLSSFAFLTPLTGVTASALILDEPLSPQIGLALALIGAGLFLVNRPQRRMTGRAA